MSADNPQVVDQLSETIEEQFPQTLQQLDALVRVPGVAFPGFPAEEVIRAANLTVDILRDAGCNQVHLIEMGDNPPAVYAEVPGPPGSPVVLLYAHYDVQPAGDLEAWTSPPFAPEIRDDRMYGRGAADDKSGVILHAAVIRAFGGQPPCTVRIIIEGDEEYGGSFEAYPKTNPELFDADAMIIADTGNIETGVPTITTALRGMAAVTLSVRTLESPVHSGMFGGPAPDALTVLVTLLATLWDSSGDVSIEGIPATEWGGTGYDEALYRELAGIDPGQPLLGTGSVSSRLITKPAVNIIGLDAPSVAGAINAVVPHASAKVSLRLPPGVNPKQAQQALSDHLTSHAPWGVSVDIELVSTGEGFRADTSGPAFDAMREALQQAYGREAVEAGAGGSIPLVSTLHEVAPNADIVLFGAQDTAARIHAPNESLNLDELRRSILAEALFLLNMAAHGSPRAVDG
jgi:cysteinylglycine-S-conjugate dipeptidase